MSDRLDHLGPDAPPAPPPRRREAHVAAALAAFDAAHDGAERAVVATREKNAPDAQESTAVIRLTSQESRSIPGGSRENSPMTAPTLARPSFLFRHRAALAASVTALVVGSATFIALQTGRDYDSRVATPPVGATLVPPPPPRPVPSPDSAATAAAGELAKAEAEAAAKADVASRVAAQAAAEAARPTMSAPPPPLVTPQSVPGRVPAAPAAGLPAPGNAQLAPAPMAAAKAPAFATGHFAPSPPVADQLARPPESGDKFEAGKTEGVKVVASEPLSTFSADVDTAAYAFVRSSLRMGVLPPPEAVRIEEIVNYFDYGVKGPSDRAVPFASDVSLTDHPFAAGHKLMRVSIKGYELPAGERPSARLTFLIDTSGSMNGPDRLPLVIASLKLLLDSLTPDSTVAIVTYAGSSAVALEPTKASDKARIAAVLDGLMAGGSTAGANGIATAYALAEKVYDKAATNRVILATDGDFNVGVADKDQLTRMIEEKRKSGIFLSILGVGRGNYNDALMQRLAQNGNGQAAYIDTLAEARKVLVKDAGGTLHTIASDVKFQVEFNPARIAEYRLVGYETRVMAAADFNDDRKDAGEIGAGHEVTAFYDLTPVGAATAVDPLRYGQAPATKPAAGDGELAFVKMRYKRPGESTSQLTTRAVTHADDRGPLDKAGEADRFAAAAMIFAETLKTRPADAKARLAEARRLAAGAKGGDPDGYRAEFIQLIDIASGLTR